MDANRYRPDVSLETKRNCKGNGVGAIEILAPGSVSERLLKSFEAVTFCGCFRISIVSILYTLNGADTFLIVLP